MCKPAIVPIVVVVCFVVDFQRFDSVPAPLVLWQSVWSLLLLAKWLWKSSRPQMGPEVHVWLAKRLLVVSDAILVELLPIEIFPQPIDM
jgi:hypothetical protein